jgi:hypothetical protein
MSLLKIIICSLVLSFGSTPNMCVTELKEKKVRTPIAQDELYVVLTDAHVNVFGYEPSKNRASMAWAQVAFENGRGDQVFNHNLGNIGSNPIVPKRPYYVISGHRFRSLETFNDGAELYWITLESRCGSTLNFFDSGDPVSASSALNRCGYYRADVDHYTKNLSSLFFERLMN